MVVWLQQGCKELLSPVLTRRHKVALKNENHPVQHSAAPGKCPIIQAISLSIKMLIKNFAKLNYISSPVFCSMLLFNLWGHRIHDLMCWE